MRNSWARSLTGTHTVVKTAVFHFVLKNLSPKTDTVAKNKIKGNCGKKGALTETNDDEGIQEDDISAINVKPAPKDTTTIHFIKFVNELHENEFLNGSYLVMDNASISQNR